MTESDIQKLLAEASQALHNQQYAAAEDLQRRAIQLLETQSEASRVAGELEKLAGIHFQQGKWNNIKGDRRQVRIQQHCLLLQGLQEDQQHNSHAVSEWRQ